MEKTDIQKIVAFAKFIAAERGLENPTMEQCREIAAHALRNFAQIEEAYTIAETK